MKYIMVLFICPISIFCQVNKSSDLFKTMFSLDSILFNEGYNNCNTVEMAKIIHDDFIMYHDQAGISSGKENLVMGIKNGICEGLGYKATRQLDESSLEVFPLHSNGSLYGAIQKGVHSFYALYPGKSEKILTSTARYTHLWLLVDDQWKLKESLSYDHISP